MPSLICWFAALILLCVPRVLAAAEAPIPPSPDRWVTDTAGFLQPETVRALDAKLSAYAQSTGHQVIVWVGQSTGDAPIEDWAVKTFEKWRVGRKGIDDGLAIFIMADDRRMRIEVGYGLEDVVPDAIASRIIQEVMTPRLRAGDPDGAVTAGVNAVLTAIGGGTGAPGPSRSPTAQPTPIKLTRTHKIIFVILGLGFLVLLVTHPSLALYLLISILSSGGRHSHGRGRGGGGFGGGGFGGGGFSGGGGRSGGGGASGSW